MFQQIGVGDSSNMNTNMKMKMNMHVLSQEVQNHQWPSSSSSSSSSSSFTSQAQPDGMRQSQDLDINRVCPLPLPLSLEEMVSPPLREASSWPLLPAQLSYNNASMRQLNVAGDCSKDKEFPPFLQYDNNNSNTNNSSSSCDMLTPSSPTTSQVLQQASPPTHSPPSNQLLPFLISNNSPSSNHALLEPVSSELTQDKGSIPRITTCVVEDKEPSNDHSSEDGEVVNNSSKKAKNLGSHSQGVLKKEKLGDKITALQQLVSPFGKTDTASVLLEAIGYIKFLQDQVQVLSSPYMKSTRQDTNGYSTNRTSTGTENQGAEDLRSRGLCLVPVSCTLNMANNNGADYWASGMGGGSSSRYS